MPRRAKPHKTFHISVPEEDTEIMEWLSKQYNQSSSVRELIRDAARSHGMTDLFVGIPATRTQGTRGAARQPTPEQLQQKLDELTKRKRPAKQEETPSPPTRTAEPPTKTITTPPKNKNGIRLDASVLAKATEKQPAPPPTPKEHDENTIKSLQDMMDL